MRVLHVAPSIARGDGGPSEVLRNLLPALGDEGVDVALIVTTKGEPKPSDRPVGVPTVIASHSWPYLATFSLDLPFKLWRSMRGADLVHVHSVHTFPSSVALALARLLGKPVVLQPHGALGTYQFQRRPALKRLYSRFIDGFGAGSLRRVVFASGKELAEGADYFDGVQPVEIAIGVDEALFELPFLDRTDSPILFLGRLANIKRLDLALQAFALYSPADPGRRLVVAGHKDPLLGYDPVELASTLGVSENVDFVGEVDSERRLELLSDASVFISTSMDESFGMSVAEALAAGVPTLTSETVGIARAAQTDGAAIVTASDPRKIADGLRDLLSDEDRRHSMGRRARKHADGRYHWKNIASDVRVCYLSVLSEHRAASRSPSGTGSISNASS